MMFTPLPLPPPHPMVCFTPATKLVGVAVNEMMADVVGVPWATVAATKNVAQTKRVVEGCISIEVVGVRYRINVIRLIVYRFDVL